MNMIKTISILQSQKRLAVMASVFVVLLAFQLVFVSAVGIKWYTESEFVSEGQEKCIPYGSYNPSGNDISVDIEVTGSLTEAITGSATEETIVEARTPSANAEPIEFCFKVPEVYDKECLVGDYLCAKTCPETLKTYTGEIVMTETALPTLGATGSSISIAASAPLEIIVSCVPYSRDYTLMYVIAIVAVLLALGVVFSLQARGATGGRGRR